MREASEGRPDPVETVLREGGPLCVRSELPGYLKRLCEAGRGDWAKRLRQQDGVD